MKKYLRISMMQIQQYRRSPHFVNFGTKTLSRNARIPKLEDCFQSKFLKWVQSPLFFANFHEFSNLENQSLIIRFILTCLITLLIFCTNWKQLLKIISPNCDWRPSLHLNYILCTIILSQLPLKPQKLSGQLIGWQWRPRRQAGSDY